jgi:hypothetical protein
MCHLPAVYLIKRPQNKAATGFSAFFLLQFYYSPSMLRLA